MIKLMDILNEGGKLFGSRASRVTTGEMNSIFDELKRRLGDKFGKFELSKFNNKISIFYSVPKYF